MENFDIPSAKQAPASTTQPTNSNQDVDLMNLFKEKIKLITETNPFTDFVVHKRVPDELIKAIKDKGYVLTIYQYYDSADDTYKSRVKIRNPNFKNKTTDFIENIEKQCRDFGFSTNTVNLNENATKLFEMFNKF